MKRWSFIAFFLLMIGRADGSMRNLTNEERFERQMETHLGVPIYHGRGAFEPALIPDPPRGPAIEKLLEKLEGATGAARYSAEAKLVSLCHQETLLRLAGEMRGGNRDTPLEGMQCTAREDAIPVLMPLLDPRPPGPGDGRAEITAAFQHRLAWTLLSIIEWRGVFAPKSREWAYHMKLNLGDEPVAVRLNLIRLWWEKNQGAMVAKRYADATWLPVYNGKVSYFDWLETKAYFEDLRRESSLPAASQVRPAQAITVAAAVDRDAREFAGVREFWIFLAGLLSGSACWMVGSVFRQTGRISNGKA